MNDSGFLEIRHGSEVRHFPLTQQVTTIGREADNSMVLDDAAISRHHARLDMVGGVLTVTDLGSSNGTIVNGTRIQRNVPVRLRNGDVISLGGFAVMARLAAVAGEDTMFGAGATVAGAAPAVPYVPPQPVPYSAPPPVPTYAAQPPAYPPQPQVIRVEMPTAEAAPKPHAGPKWGTWAVVGGLLVISIILLNMPLCTATKVVQVEKPQTQTVMKTVMRTVTREVPETITGEKIQEVWVGYMIGADGWRYQFGEQDKIVDKVEVKNFNNLFDVTLTNVDGRKSLYQNLRGINMFLTGQIKVPTSTSKTRTVTEQVPEQVPEQVTTMVKEDVEKKVKVTPFQYMTGDY